MPAPPMIKKMWHATWLIAAIVFFIFIIYTTSYSNNFGLLSTSQAIAGTAAVMIGLSFAMSGFVYYFDFLDTKLAYRKYLGLVGFWLALAYAILLLIVNPDRYLSHLFKNIGSADVLLGLTAMVILAFMAVISNNWAIRKLGPQNWRRGLRLGYLAYGLLIVRAIILEKTIWLAWWRTPLDSLPPPRLLVTLFAIAVIFFRGSMLIAQFVRKKPPQNAPSSQN